MSLAPLLDLEGPFMWNVLEHMKCKRKESWSQRKTDINIFVVSTIESEQL